MSGEASQQRRSSDQVLEGIRDLIQVQAEHAKERHEEVVDRFEKIEESIKPFSGIDIKKLQEDVDRHNDHEKDYKRIRRFSIWVVSTLGPVAVWKWLVALFHVKGAQ